MTITVWKLLQEVEIGFNIKLEVIFYISVYFKWILEIESQLLKFI